MPYIPPENRETFDWLVEDLATLVANEGDLNYVITSICDRVIKLNGLSYGFLNQVIGVLECAKLELYRRVVAPYENHKRNVNGDVYSISNVNQK